MFACINYFAQWFSCWIFKSFSHDTFTFAVCFFDCFKEGASCSLFFCFVSFALFVPDLLAPHLPTWFNLLFTGIIAFSVEIIPGYMMAYFIFSTTSVGEFIAAMDRMHVTKKLTIPISVTFRFFLPLEKNM